MRGRGCTSRLHACRHRQVFQRTNGCHDLLPCTAHADENFGAIGAALYPRVDLLRLQQLRGVGGNAWRTAHNAPEPVLLDLADRLGVLIMGEFCVYGALCTSPLLHSYFRHCHSRR